MRRAGDMEEGRRSLVVEMEDVANSEEYSSDGSIVDRVRASLEIARWVGVSKEGEGRED